MSDDIWNEEVVVWPYYEMRDDGTIVPLSEQEWVQRKSASVTLTIVKVDRVTKTVVLR